ncbi:helix-turn-helix domain-containing protein [Streptomyces sp. NPDC056390]|uniref:AraC-like ligand-binding domain-containing protein n=1 Tax=Streptomyces sp. NPDC056390 TaxID=3345806 RepID=UPI0035DBE8E3
MQPQPSGFRIERTTAVSVTSFNDWRQAVSRTFVPLEMERSGLGPFHGSLRKRLLTDLTVCEMSASGHTFHRAPHLITRDGGPAYKLCLQLSGSGLLIQDGREAVLRPGDLAIYDVRRPYTRQFSADFQCMALMFSGDMLDLPTEAVQQLNAVRIAADDGLGGVVSSFLAQVTQNLEQITTASGRRLAHNIVDIISTLIVHELGIDSRARATAASELLHDVMEFIDANLSDPELGPAKIASAYFISTRHLHNLFRGQGTTVAAWIRSRRLERCRRDLLDPLHRDRPVAAVAARWGITEPSHFNRAFKATFGTPPGAYRAAGSTGS